MQRNTPPVPEYVTGTTGEPKVWAISEYYAPNFSGAAIQAHKILSRLVDRGHRVEVLTLADHEATVLRGQRQVLDRVVIHYLPVVPLGSWQFLRGIPRLQQAARQLNRLLRDLSFHWAIAFAVIFRMQRGDILQWYVVGDFAWPVFWLAARLGRRNFIQVSLVGADDPLSFQRSLLGVSTALKRACFRVAEKTIGLSRALTTRCEQAGVPSQQIIRIPNGVDVQRFAPQPQLRDAVCQQLQLSPTRRYLVFLGSAIERKGIDLAIRAFLPVAQRHPELDLLVIGECDFRDGRRFPPDRQAFVEQLQAEAAAADCATRIHWRGMQADVVPYLQVAELLVFPTRREGLPNALAEAMSCGLPVLASRLEGITTDLVTDGIEGRLVDGFDAADYEAALEQLWRESHLRTEMGLAARRRIENEFALTQIVARYEDLYRGVNLGSTAEHVLR